MTLDTKLLDYRNQIFDADQKQQESFDKTLITLSGGALGITFAFIKDIIGSNPIICPILISIAWILWGLSLCSTLFSFYASHLSLTKLISEIDDVLKSKQVNNLFENFSNNPYRKITKFLNISSAILFALGVILTAIFSFLNIT